METFTGYGQFNEKLKFGNKLEDLVQKKLLTLDYDARLTPQDKDNRDPELGNCDVVVYELGRPILGIECKLMKEPFRISPYPDNIPLNQSSIDTYSSVDFPIYILAGQLWTGNLYAAELDEVKQSPHIEQKVDYKRTMIVNYDGKNWFQSHSLDVVLKHILKIQS